MTSAIGPGDWVECIDVSWRPLAHYPPSQLIVGAVYQVEDVDRDAHDPGIWLVGITSPHCTGTFSTSHFKPIYRPKAKLIEDLLKVDELSPIEVLFEAYTEWEAYQ